ncbi:hypothetical protein CWI39_0116p0020 [Hamiltosporidium magnivora]|uniref:Uncharacterized protein n=1 Tax=Hamiltosporidium magnivora TaxID=148818 RepID=A0A4Q9LL34_9MICR|nr:hypothetical protein CWI39_0116p0020 [Hamiltosporidium magnivora]
MNLSYFFQTFLFHIFIYLKLECIATSRIPESNAYPGENTGHIKFSNYPKDLLSFAIHHIPNSEIFCKFLGEVLIDSHTSIIQKSLEKLQKAMFTCSKNLKHDEFQLGVMYYRAYIDVFKNDLYNMFKDVIGSKYTKPEEINEDISVFANKLNDRIFMNKLKEMKQWNSKKLTMKKNKYDIKKLIKDISEYEKISKFVFEQFFLFCECFFSPIKHDISLKRYLILSASPGLQKYSKNMERHDDYFKNIKQIYGFSKFGSCLESEFIDSLNNCDEIKFSIILESEYLISVFIRDLIKKIGETNFLQMFSSENFSKNEQLALKHIYKQIESIEELEPFKSEISGSLTQYLNFLKKDVRVVFAFRKLDERLFSFIKNEILTSFVSKATNKSICNGIFQK